MLFPICIGVQAISGSLVILRKVELFMLFKQFFIFKIFLDEPEKWLETGYIQIDNIRIDFFEQNLFYQEKCSFRISFLLV